MYASSRMKDSDVVLPQDWPDQVKVEIAKADEKLTLLKSKVVALKNFIKASQPKALATKATKAEAGM